MAEPGHYQMFTSIRRALGDVSKCGCQVQALGCICSTYCFPCSSKARKGRVFHTRRCLTGCLPRKRWEMQDEAPGLDLRRMTLYQYMNLLHTETSDSHTHQGFWQSFCPCGLGLTCRKAFYLCRL